MYCPLNLHTHYSLLRGFAKPAKIAKIAEKFNMKAIAITDYDSLSGSVNFYKAMSGSGIKPILGTKTFISDLGGYITLIAKNKKGWSEIVTLSSKSHNVEKPMLLSSELKMTGNVICICGEPESALANSILTTRMAYLSNTQSSFIKTDADSIVDKIILTLKEIFKNDLYVGISNANSKDTPIDGLIATILRNSASKCQVKTVAIPNVFYSDASDADDLRLLLCAFNKTNYDNLYNSINNEDKSNLNRFLYSNEYGLPSLDVLTTFHTNEEIKHSLEIMEKCEEYSILANPSLPKFDCPDGMSEKDYLRHLCREGWLKFKNRFDKSRTQEYVDRVKTELSVFSDANLEGYFLIVQDYVKWAKKQGALVGCGRGSAGGCLVSFLTEITTIDPVAFDLFFERFYNVGRNAPGKTSLPDIDIDFPVAYGELAIDYIRNKHKPENVCQVATFSRMKGRGSVREVLRIKQSCDTELMDIISKRIPKEEEISDKLEEAKETSVIRWALRNEPELLKDWCTIDDNDVLSGDYAEDFKQAIRIENTYKSYGKHASALIISDSPVAARCPMIRDKKTGSPIAGIEYEELESMGLPKFDILRTSVLDKLMGVNQILRYGKLNKVVIEKEDEDDDY